ncbi:MAG: lipoate--protein ligase [Bacteroidota bacterium]
MKFIIGESTDPYFNLAAEEYLLKATTDEYFMLWQNEPSIIVGKHQNTLAEINLEVVRERGFKVARRISGGGTVFHDLGNLNFTFITGGEDGDLVNFRKYTLPIVSFLRSLGVEAELSGRNDLLIDGRKFSGNASHVYNKRVLHHGTILFSSVMEDLADALKVNPLKFTDKAVKSVRSRVTNIREHLKREMDVTEFRDRLMSHVIAETGGGELYRYTEEDLREIGKRREEKFSTWDWNFGYSPKYRFEKGIRTAGGIVEVQLNVEKGMIQEISIHGDFFNTGEVEELEALLRGTVHDPEAIGKRLEHTDIGYFLNGVTREEFFSVLF